MEVIAVAMRSLIVLAIIYAVIAVGAHFLSLSMIFPRPPVKYSMGPDYIELTAPDGVKLAARYWPNQNAVGQSCTPVYPKGVVSSCTTHPGALNIDCAVTRPGGRSASIIRAPSCAGRGWSR